MGSAHWQTGSRTGVRQRVPKGMKWVPLVTSVDGKLVDTFWCPIAAEYDIDWALRVLPGSGRLWVRVMRMKKTAAGPMPTDATDHGTRWVGPIRLGPLHTYDGRNLMDKQGGKVGEGYRIEARSDLGCSVDQFYLKLDPRVDRD